MRRISLTFSCSAYITWNNRCLGNRDILENFEKVAFYIRRCYSNSTCVGDVDTISVKDFLLRNHFWINYLQSNSERCMYGSYSGYLVSFVL